MQQLIIKSTIITGLCFILPYHFFFQTFHQNPWLSETHPQHLSPWQPVHSGQRALEKDKGRRRRQVFRPRPVQRRPHLLVVLVTVSQISVAQLQAARGHGDGCVCEHRLLAVGDAASVHAHRQPDHQGSAQLPSNCPGYNVAGQRQLCVHPGCRPPRWHGEYEPTRHLCVDPRWYRKSATAPQYVR